MILQPLPSLLSKEYDSDSLIYRDDNEFYYNRDFDKDLLKDISENRFQIYNGSYRYLKEWNSPKIYLMGRGETCGKKIFKIQGFLPYCFIESDKGEYNTYLGDRVEKILFKTEPRRVADLRRYRERIGTLIPYEADIPFVRRLLIDVYDFFKPKKPVMPRICIFDVETNFPVNNSLIAFSINSYDDGFLYHTSRYLSDKYEMAVDAYDKIIQYDLVANWNVDFDLVQTLKPKLLQLKLAFRPLEEGLSLHLKEYINKLAIDYNLFGIATSKKILDALIKYDYLRITDNIVEYGNKEFNTDIELLVASIDLKMTSKKMYGREIRGRWSLDNAGKNIVGIGKKDFDKRYPRDMSEYELYEYNTMDVIIPEIIDDYLGGCECHVILSWSLQSMIKDVMITAVVNDLALLREYHRNKIVLPSRPPYDIQKNEEETYKAAEPDARPGVYSNILVTDLHAAYPSTVIAINASSETKDKRGIYQAPNGIRFNAGNSVFISTLKSLLAEREVIKTNLKTMREDNPKWRTLKFIDFALKTQVAAFSHGIFGWSNSRMKDMDVADAITATVRGILDVIKKKVDELGYLWCYVHTDSCYFEAPKDKAEEIIRILNDTVKEYCKSQGYSIVPKLEYKGFYPKAYIHSPARNVLVDEKGNWKTTGMNYMRSEVPLPLVDIEKEIIAQKLSSTPDNDIIDELKDMIVNLKKESTIDLGIIKPLNKRINRYGYVGKYGTIVGIPYHIKALIKSKDEYGFNINVGEKFRVIPVISEEDKIYVAYPLEEELPDIYKIDWIQYLRSNLWGKISSLFEMKPKELENTILDDRVKEELNIGKE